MQLIISQSLIHIFSVIFIHVLDEHFLFLVIIYVPLYEWSNFKEIKQVFETKVYKVEEIAE